MEIAINEKLLSMEKVSVIDTYEEECIILI